MRGVEFERFTIEVPDAVYAAFDDNGDFSLEAMEVLRRVEANVMGWGFGAVVAVGKAVGAECEV